MTTTRRNFIAGAAAFAAAAPHLVGAATASSSVASPGDRSIAPTSGQSSLPKNAPAAAGQRWRPPHRVGLGGVPISNGFSRVIPDATAIAIMDTAWQSGIRMYDTSPFYTLGRGERRMGQVLSSQPRDQFILSTKVGRLLVPERYLTLRQVAIWADAPPFRHVFDYTASGTRRSIEDSLQRMGVSSLDIVYVHDLSPDTPDLPGKDWEAQFQIATTGAFRELSKMRQEGIIKGWGLGVNRPDPILRALEVADPDILLAATQYSLADHSDALSGIVPAVERHGASIMVGAPLNGGFIAGADRFNYRNQIPAEMLSKRMRMQQIAAAHGVDLRTAALQFLSANPTISAIIPGASRPEQVVQNVQSFSAAIPAAFWSDLRSSGLVDARAPLPGDDNAWREPA